MPASSAVPIYEMKRTTKYAEHTKEIIFRKFRVVRGPNILLRRGFGAGGISL